MLDLVPKPEAGLWPRRCKYCKFSVVSTSWKGNEVPLSFLPLQTVLLDAAHKLVSSSLPALKCFHQDYKEKKIQTSKKIINISTRLATNEALLLLLFTACLSTIISVWNKLGSLFPFFSLFIMTEFERMDGILLLMVWLVLRTSKKVSRDMSLWFWRWYIKMDMRVFFPPNLYHQLILKSFFEFPSSVMTEGTRLCVPWVWISPTNVPKSCCG